MNNRIDLNQISTVADMIRDMLGEDFDSETFLDTLDGETDAMDAIGHLIRERVDAKATEAAMKEVASTYAERARRFKRKQDAITAALGSILDAMGEGKVAHPMGTVSRTKPRVSLSILNAEAIPSQLCKAVPDTAAIKAQLEAGEDVPGATLETGEPGLTVRVK